MLISVCMMCFGSLVIACLPGYRRSLNETSDKKSRQHKDAGSISGLLRNHTRAFLMVLGFTAGGSLSFYTFTTYIKSIW